MVQEEALGLLVGAVALGTVHGIEPGHGWPVAASYALDRANEWVYGFAASLILGIGHLVSSIAMVAAFFYAKSYFDLAQVNEPIRLTETIVLGGPVSLVAGLLLVVLGIREYRHGHSHGHGRGLTTDDGHDHSTPRDQARAQDPSHQPDHSQVQDHAHDHAGVVGHDHSHEGNHGEPGHEHAPHEPGHEHATHEPGYEHDQGDGGLWAGLVAALPFVGGHSHDSDDPTEAAERGLWGIAWFAFLLGFAHEEEFEIIAMCSGSSYCLELMTAYALAVIVGIVGLTMLLVAGYQHFEERVERYTPYLPLVSATVLVVMGFGFVFNVF